MKRTIAKRVTKTDLFFIGGLLLIGIVSLLAVRMLGQHNAATVRILSDGKLYGTYRLSQTEQIIPIEINESVTNTLRIADNQAKMVSADCPDQLCVHQKAIKRQGEMIVCLPNKLVIEIGKTQSSDLDSVSR